MLRRVALVGTDVSEEDRISSIITVTRIVELGTFAVTSNRRRYVPTKRGILQEPHGVTPQKTAFFLVTAVKNLKSYIALTGWAL
jgi:hypothetical protein